MHRLYAGSVFVRELSLLTHSLKDEFDEVNESLVLSVRPEQMIP